MVYRGLYCYRELVRVIIHFPHIFSYCFWKESLTRTSSHLQNAARALSSPSRCFQLSKNIGEDFFRYLWYCDKKQIECGLAWHWWNSIDLGSVNWHVFNQSEGRNCCLYNHASREIWKYFQIWFFPRFGGKWRRSEHAHASYPGLSFRPPGFSRYRGREERRVQGLDYFKAGFH